MQNIPWTREYPGEITVCDTDGIILEMNDRAAKAFERDGGMALVGTNLLDCHPEPSRTKLKNMLASQTANTYTIEHRGIKKLVHQTPWYENGVYRGFVEISFAIPDPVPHFQRNG